MFNNNNNDGFNFKELKNQIEKVEGEEEEINKILNQFNFKDYNSLSNFLNIFNLYEKYPQCEIIRSKSVQYFNEYHINKIPQLIDVYNFIKFIVNVFYDPSELVFDQFRNCKLMNSKVILIEINYKIIYDKRFNQSGKFQKRLNILEIDGFFEHCKHLLLIKPPPPPLLQSKGNQIKTNIPTNNSNNNKQYNIPNYLIDKIIGYIFNVWDDYYYLRNIEIFNLSLVSKQFFKVISKQLIDTRTFPFLCPIEKMNSSNGSSFSFTYQSPIKFEYDSFQFIKYNTSEEQLNSIFSKVETFIINSDEFDYSTTKSVFRDIREYYGSDDDGYDDSYYRESIVSDNYLIYPPKMPSLKNLTILNYYGYTNNYENLLLYIIKTNSTSIEHFSISICNNWSRKDVKSNPLVILNQLLNYHSSTLKIITIEFSKELFHVALGFFLIFKESTLFGKIKLNILSNGKNLLDNQTLHNYILFYNYDMETYDELFSYVENQK